MATIKEVKVAIRDNLSQVEGSSMELANIVDILHRFERETWNDVVAIIRKMQRNGECMEARSGYFRLI